VRLNLSNFKQFVESISSNGKNGLITRTTSADSLKSHFAHLLYLAYDSSGKEVGRIRQRAATGSGYKYIYDPTSYHDSSPYTMPFGTIVDSLPAGNYTIVLAGSNYKHTISDRRAYDPGQVNLRPLNEAYLGQEHHLSMEIPETEDTFYKKFTINIQNQAVEEDVTLERITGKLEVNILDAIPTNAAVFDVKIYKAATIISLGTSTFSGGTYYGEDDYENTINDFLTENVWQPIKITDSERGTTNYRYSRFLYGRDSVPITIVIRCFDAQMNLIAHKIVKNIRIYKNRRTILKGRLFDSRSEAAFNVSVNSEWDPNTVEVPF
jgi:hypothetical protein